jgi:hypothetical protein
LIGTLNFAIGAAASSLLGAIAEDGTELPMVAMMTACAVIAFALSFPAFRGLPEAHKR